MVVTASACRSMPIDQRHDRAEQPAEPPAALPREYAHHASRDRGQQKDIHARRLRIHDHRRQQRDAGGESQIPVRTQETTARQPRQTRSPAHRTAPRAAGTPTRIRRTAAPSRPSDTAASCRADRTFRWGGSARPRARCSSPPWPWFLHRRASRRWPSPQKRSQAPTPTMASNITRCASWSRSIGAVIRNNSDSERMNSLDLRRQGRNHRHQPAIGSVREHGLTPYNNDCSNKPYRS